MQSPLFVLAQIHKQKKSRKQMHGKHTILTFSTLFYFMQSPISLAMQGYSCNISCSP